MNPICYDPFEDAPEAPLSSGGYVDNPRPKMLVIDESGARVVEKFQKPAQEASQ